MIDLCIVTSFDKDIYNATGKRLLAGIAEHLPEARVAVYPEGDSDEWGTEWKGDPDFRRVFLGGRIEEMGLRQWMADLYPHCIPVDQGGTKTDAKGWQHRWWQWFCKIVAQHHAIHYGIEERLLIWLDSDVIVRSPFTADDILSLMDKPIGYFLGEDRLAVETGVILYNVADPACREFIDAVADCYLSGKFQQLERWDDSYVFYTVGQQERFADKIQDFAAGKKGKSYVTSTGDRTGGQVIPQTEFHKWFEHEKGRHIRVDGLETWLSDEQKEQNRKVKAAEKSARGAR